MQKLADLVRKAQFNPKTDELFKHQVFNEMLTYMLTKWGELTEVIDNDSIIGVPKSRAWDKRKVIEDIIVLLEEKIGEE